MNLKDSSPQLSSSELIQFFRIDSKDRFPAATNFRDNKEDSSAMINFFHKNQRPPSTGAEGIDVIPSTHSTFEIDW